MNAGPGTADFTTPENSATLAYLTTAIEHAPASPGPLADNIRGWWTADGWCVCAICAGRIMARGCQLPRGREPVWADKPEPFGVCCCCEK